MAGERKVSWEAALSILTAVLAMATLGVVWVTYQQVKESRKLVEVSQKTLSASQRPFLAPTSKLTLISDTDGRHFDFQQLDPGEEITLKNGGPGLALNICGVLVQPRPHADVELNIAPRLRYMIFDTPVLPGGEIMLPAKGGGFIIGWETFVGDDPVNSLIAPKAPKIGEQLRDAVYRVVARLTVTYDDISGVTYASQYDYTDQGMWRFHMSGKVTKGVEALARERYQELAAPTST